MRALVTGSAGHLGAFLVRELRSRGHHVFGFDWLPDHREDYLCGSVTNADEVAHAFDRSTPDVVFHLAARVSRVVAEEARGLTMSVNVEGTRNVAAACTRWNALLVNVSTSEVYGDATKQSEGSLCRPNNWYGLTKLLAEQVVDYYRTDGLRAVTVRPFMLYSEDEGSGVHRSAMRRFVDAILTGKPIELHRKARRSWLHMEDAARILVDLGSWSMPGVPVEILNIGSPDVRPIAELADLIAAEIGIASCAIAAPLPPRMTATKDPDLTIQHSLGFVPSISLEEGVGRVCARAVDLREKECLR